MTVEQVQARLLAILEESRDPEVAHGMEDALWGA
jgi:hypothetical protein